MAQKLEVKVREIIARTNNVMSFRMGLDHQGNFKAGQFLAVTLKSNPQLKRYLSISSSPTEKGYVEFTKKITESDFCKVLTGLKPGDPVIIEYPLGNFTLKDGYKRIGFLSGGIGITPIRSICKYAVDKKLDTDIVLLYANRTVNDIAFREDFAAMQKNFPPLKLVHVLGEDAPGFPCIVGRIDAQLIRKEIPDYPQRRFYLCGPPAMVEAMQKILLEELGLQKEDIVTENFQGY